MDSFQLKEWKLNLFFWIDLARSTFPFLFLFKIKKLTYYFST